MEESELLDPSLVEASLEGTYVSRMLADKPTWPLRTIEGFLPFRIRPLGYDQEAECHIAARKWLTSKGMVPAQNEALASNEATVRILFKAFVTEDSDPAKPDKAKPLAASIEEWRQFPLLTDLNIALLWIEYQDVKLSMSSTYEALPPAMRAAVIDELKKNPKATLPERWPRAWLLGLIVSLAELVKSLIGSNSSTTDSSESQESKG